MFFGPRRRSPTTPRSVAAAAIETAHLITDD